MDRGWCGFTWQRAGGAAVFFSLVCFAVTPYDLTSEDDIAACRFDKG